VQQLSACTSAGVLQRVADKARRSHCRCGAQEVAGAEKYSLYVVCATAVNRVAQLQDFVLSRLQRIPDVKVATPQGAFYVLPDVSAYYGKSPPDGSQVVSSRPLNT
jgi:aspartate/methionine/tyrosine aminotransferase